MDRAKRLQEIEAVIQKGPFQDNWDSLGRYQVPMWYKNNKFGIFIHWGIYSVPAFNSEWYSRNMYIQGSEEYEHHIKTYGAHKDFGYKDFIPMFQAEKFDAKEWVDLFDEAGARYVVPVAEHHDGFQMYKSELSHWNSFEMGPKRDVLGELSTEMEKHGIVNGASSHRVEHWFFMGHGKQFESDITDEEQLGDFYWPAHKEPNHHDIFSEPTPSQEFMEDWLLRCCELVDQYQPKVFYFDWWIQHSAVKPYLKKFAAYYYNRGAEWGTGCVINYKHDAFMFGSAVVDIERGQFAECKPYFWQTDTAAARNSWCYTEKQDYKSAEEIVRSLVDIVSKNGTLLLNIGPKADGSIPDGDKAILQQVGKWLKANGEAIYDTSYWRFFGEGPTKVEEGQFSDGKELAFTKEDIRFTVKGSKLYATVLSYPEDGKVVIKSLAEQDASIKPLFHGIVTDVKVLGFEETPEWKRDEEGLHIQTKQIQSAFPVCFCIEID
jgi:alpha-L-fucosidase